MAQISHSLLPARLPEEIRYSQFLTMFPSDWEQGQHLGLIGPSGCGKSWVAKDVLDMRKYAILATVKPTDSTMERYKGYAIIERWNQVRYSQKHVLYWPYFQHLRDMRQLQDEVYSMLDGVFRSRGWTLDFDDLRVLCQQLGLMRDIATMYVFCRSSDTSLVGCFQRLPWVCPEAYGQCSHLLVWHIKSDEDLVAIAKAMGENPKVVRAMNERLRRYDFMLLSEYAEPVIIRKER